MKCPYPDCGKTNIDPHHEKAITYCHSYGGCTFFFQCELCREIYSVCFRVEVKHDKPCIIEGLSVADMSYW